MAEEAQSPGFLQHFRGAGLLEDCWKSKHKGTQH
jgi:hypothetical protein